MSGFEAIFTVMCFVDSAARMAEVGLLSLMLELGFGI